VNDKTQEVLERELRLYQIALNTARKLERGRAVRLLKEDLAKAEEPVRLGLEKALATIQEKERT
jgi:hypothetical protein